MCSSGGRRDRREPKRSEVSCLLLLSISLCIAALVILQSSLLTVCPCGDTTTFVVWLSCLLLEKLMMLLSEEERRSTIRSSSSRINSDLVGVPKTSSSVGCKENMILIDQLYFLDLDQIRFCI